MTAQEVLADDKSRSKSCNFVTLCTRPPDVDFSPSGFPSKDEEAPLDKPAGVVCLGTAS